MITRIITRLFRRRHEEIRYVQQCFYCHHEGELTDRYCEECGSRF